MPVDELEAWLRLLLTPGVGRVQARHLLAAAGSPQAVFELSHAALQALGLERCAAALAARPAELDGQLRATLEWLEGGGDRFVFTLGDAGYPPPLLDIDDPPLVLYAMGALARRWAASSDRFHHGLRQPSSSVNYIASHDGFTLLDLVSYERKHNEANGEGNRDGDDSNHSTNCGFEGSTTNPQINEIRARLRRGMIATMFCSLGVPFLTAGDERGRTQRGNNNAYCQDSEISWLDWSTCDEDMLEFTRRITAFRREHSALRRSTYFNGNPNHDDESSSPKG
jgi:hypothetical protein